MRKFSEPQYDDRSNRHRWKCGNILTISVGLLFTPLVYEASLLCAAQWRAMSGPISKVDTPVLDSLNSVWQWAKDDIRVYAKPSFFRLIWKPAYLFPFIIFWTGIAVLILRKC